MKNVELMKDYKNFVYLYPPRPENAVSVDMLSHFKEHEYFAQPKLNGSCCMLFMNESQIIKMNRHNEKFSSFKVPESDIRDIYKSNGWMVLCAEYLNKSKSNTLGLFNQKLVIFDILVFDSMILTGYSTEDRFKILTSIYQSENYDNFINKINDSIYIVKSFEENFDEVYESLMPIEIYEGLVLKKKSSKLVNPNTSKANSMNQIKFRKPTKNYIY